MEIIERKFHKNIWNAISNVSRKRMFIFMLGIFLATYILIKYYSFNNYTAIQPNFQRFISENEIEETNELRITPHPDTIPIPTDELQILRALTFNELPTCSSGKYSRYARFLFQKEWIDEKFDSLPMINNPPLIYYDKSEIWPKPSVESCRFKCRFSHHVADFSQASMAVFKSSPPIDLLLLNKEVRLAMANVESPSNMPRFSPTVANKFEIFQTYQLYSTIPIPYGSFVAFKEPFCSINDVVRKQMMRKNNLHLLPKYHRSRTNLVAWVVSNSYMTMAREYEYKKLSAFIKIDRFGGTYRRCNDSINGDACFRILSRTYKFYLSFENSNCVEYITEKLFRNALGNGMVPIVFGGTREEYYDIAPPNSYIHVDDFNSTKELAEYIQLLDKNDTAYSNYFAWKEYGKLKKDDSSACRACGVLHLILNGTLPTEKGKFKLYGEAERLCGQH